MRVLASADWHLGLQRYGTPGPDGVSSRVRDFEQTLGRFVKAAIEHDVAVALFLGDTFNTRREGPHERAAFAAAVAALREHGITVVILDGNHDGKSTVGDAQSAALLWIDALQMPGVHVFLEPDVAEIQTDDGPVIVTAMPYPHRRVLDRELADVAPSDRVLLAGGRIEKRIAEMAASIEDGTLEPFDIDAPRLFVGHLTVADSIAGSETAMQMGWDVAIHRRALAPFDLSVLGHIHRYQRLGQERAWYCGSPEYIDFTEAGLEKGFLLANFERGGEPTVTLIPSEPRPMLDLDVLLEDGAWAMEASDPALWERGPIVRLRVRATAKPDPTLLAKLERHAIEIGASFVKTVLHLPEIVPIDRRAGEPDPELDLMEATRRHLVAAGFPKVDAAMEAARKLVAV